MSDKNSHFSLLFFGLEFLILNTAFMAVNYFKYATFVLSPFYYINLLVTLNLIWLFVSILMKKHNAGAYRNYRYGIMLLVKSAIIAGYIVCFIFIFTELFAFSRLLIFGTLFLILLGEIIVFTIYYLVADRTSVITDEKTKAGIFQKQRISTRLLIYDFLLINFSFFAINYFKSGSFNLNPGYAELLIIIYGVWIVVSLITRKFDIDHVQDIYNALSACIKSLVLMVVSMSVLIYALRLHYYSRSQIFGTIAMFFFFEIFLYGFYAITKKEKAREKDVESVEQLKAYFNQDNLMFDTPDFEAGLMPEDPVKDKLETALEFFNPWLFKFVDNCIDLCKISRNNTSILSTDDLVRLRNSDDKILSLIINLYRLNHFRRVNQYFLEAHKKLKAGGYFIGKVSTTQTHKEKIKERFPKCFAEVLYMLHFVFFRIFPKLPFTRQIYFTVTRGRNRIMSKAEVLGRLYFCGFEIIAEQEIDYYLYFIARKVTSPSSVTNPSYGPLLKMIKSGMNGQPITVYKFRTMYPYSEFLQKYIYERNSLQVGGKLKNDFRVTGWGKIMRKIWIDELPMLYNWIRGELKIVGVRPLSSHYLSLYDNELQELRKNIKPGLIPPFFADLPKTFNEICESEKRYLRAYKRNPIKTQCCYFIKAMNNIVIKNARSQ